MSYSNYCVGWLSHKERIKMTAMWENIDVGFSPRLYEACIKVSKLSWNYKRIGSVGPKGIKTVYTYQLWKSTYWLTVDMSHYVLPPWLAELKWRLYLSSVSWWKEDDAFVMMISWWLNGLLPAVALLLTSKLSWNIRRGTLR